MSLPGFEDIPGLTNKALKCEGSCIDILRSTATDCDPVPSVQFQKMFGLRPSEVSALIGYLRIIGHPIGSNNRGYFYARRPTELDETIAHLESRVKRINRIRDRLAEIRRGLRPDGKTVQQADIFSG